MSNMNATVAMSLLVHGEAVRLNRGQARGDDYDFKYMSDGKGGVIPYVSSQCFKKYWRETLDQPFSPVTRGTNAAGNEKNQVYTDGNPIDFVDDDLFGYMRAGANIEESQGDDRTEENAGPDQADAELASILFNSDDFQDRTAMLSQFKKGKGDFYIVLQTSINDEVRPEYNGAGKEVSDELLDIMIEALNKAISKPGDSGHELKGNEKKAVEGGAKTHSQAVRDYISKQFDKALRPSLPTTRRTSPIRMHALVAFSGVYMAKDFQTFARDTAYTGKNSVLNPNKVGIYSGWLKTRILIEGHRIGKFYLGENREMVLDQLSAIESVHEVQTENNPYSHKRDQVSFVQLDSAIRLARLQSALKSLADIGNRQGPASGALHDGSLRPKGFVAAFMNCADSPFDSVWQGTDGLPYLDTRRLKEILIDWEDLFASKTVYIGYPVEMRFSAKDFEETLNGDELKDLADKGFEFEVDTPRKALLKMANDSAL